MIKFDQLATLAGKYGRPFADVFLALLGGKLVGRVSYKIGFPDKDDPLPPDPPTFSLEMMEEDRLMVMDGPGKSSKVENIRREGSSIGWLRAGRIRKNES